MIYHGSSPQSGVIDLDDMRQAVAQIETLPIDLTEERIDGSREPVWRQLMKFIAKEGVGQRTLNYEWMGYKVSIIVCEVRHNAFIFGNEISKPVGKLFLIKIQGESGVIIMGEIPSMTGHVATFISRADKQEFVDVMKIFVRSILD